jgi:chemotaxis protein MotB
MGGKYENPYEILEKDILEEVKRLGIDQSVELSTGTDGITLVARDKSFFSSGSITMNPEASSFIENIGHLLSRQKFTFKIVVEGHTDDVPINHSLFPSNWELSLRRASEVVRTFERLGIPRTNLLPQGLADTKPVKDPVGLSGTELESARSTNRRIVIKLLKKI